MKPYQIFKILILLICPNILHAQDIHFSNYYMSPLSLNPANTGNYSGNWRLMNNYRQQGDNLTNSYTTASLAFDHPVYFRNEKASLGLLYIYDNSANNTLLVNKVYLSAGYFLKITSQSYLHIGFQGGFVHKRYSLNGLTLPDQFDMSQGIFNPQLSTQESFENQSLYYLDFNWGLIWSRKTATLNTEIGVAMFHFNQPEEVFFEGKNRLEPRYQIHALAKKKISGHLYLRPKALFAVDNHTNELLVGADIGLLLKENEAFKDFYFGIHYRGGYNRISDALIFKTGFNYLDFDIAFAYDLEISGQKISSYTSNAFEVSIIFTRPETSLKERTIPCDIF